jgi:hypothetical protein
MRVEAPREPERPHVPEQPEQLLRYPNPAHEPALYAKPRQGDATELGVSIHLAPGAPQPMGLNHARYGHLQDDRRQTKGPHEPPVRSAALGEDRCEQRCTAWSVQLPIGMS